MSDLKERLVAQQTIARGKPFTATLPDGTHVRAKSGDTVRLRNPDGPEALALLSQLEADKVRLEEALREIGSGEAFRQPRYAEDDADDYYLRCQRAVQLFARQALGGTDGK